MANVFMRKDVCEESEEERERKREAKKSMGCRNTFKSLENSD